MTRCVATAFVVLAGVLSLNVRSAPAQVWGRAAVPREGACFYEDIHFNGRYFCVSAGDSQPEVPTGTNDRISSIRIFGGSEVIVFRDSRFRGSSQRFGASVEDLRRSGWNDRITSFQVDRRRGGGPGYDTGGGNWGRPSVPQSGVCFYEDPNFNGDYFCAAAGSATNEVPRGTNDKISSVRLFGNATVEVFQDARFEGRSARFDRDQPDLHRSGWNDLISSFRVGRGGFGGGGYRPGNGRMSVQQAEAIVRQAYLSVLGREPDSGSQVYVNRLMNDGWSRERVEGELRNSAEYRRRRD
jgi:hypothetical protein